MAADNKKLKTTMGDVAPQVYDEILDDYVIAKGSNGSPFFVERGTIAMETWDNTAPVTTFSGNRYGFFIVNDGTADLTFTINSKTRKVKSGENYEAKFDAFTSVTINATSAYRAEVYR